MTFIPLPAFNDNYIWVHEFNHTGDLLVVDPGDAQVVLDYCQRKQKRVAAILITHRHNDHVGGVSELRVHFQCDVFGPASLHPTIVTQPQSEGDTITLGDLSLTVWETPGHTDEHLCYVSQTSDQKFILCGDTLFRGGCGRLFDGTPTQMQQSLSRFLALHDDTELYGTHEYTLSNYRFAEAVDSNNPMLLAAVQDAQNLRDIGHPTLPSTIGLERTTNPFLRFDQTSIVSAAAKLLGESPATSHADGFSQIRRAKDGF